MNRKRTLNAVIVLFVISALYGCGDRNSQHNLMQSLQEIRNRPSGKIEPLPKRPEYQPVLYTGTDQRSPFHLYEKQESAPGRYRS
ncbi:pilus assembly protein PilP, partial [Oceanospirillum sp. HFRX-1_2]